MKNREKFRDEILKSAVIQGRDLCDFKRKVVFPHFGKEDGCSGISCAWCRMLTDLWFNEEYIEPLKPEVDWSKVPVDTLVRVWDTRAYECVLRYFKGIDDSNPTRKYVAWAKGATSVTAYGQVTHWKHCELVEAEDDSN